MLSALVKPRTDLSRPRSSFTLSQGTGYAGPGYYYGPPQVPYPYQGPDTRYSKSSNASGPSTDHDAGDLALEDHFAIDKPLSLEDCHSRP